ncbi:glycosyltransferase family 2 protein [Flavobacterium sp. RSSB_23]|uniref:glycosyltransferase family 2 protein n=1 Tax=Flavobacterium sp. RSSB_23 TaxID=3447668 RepID=UPI003F2E0B7A
MELNNQPIISVIIPTYKRTDYLKLTLQSILNQTFKDFEIIVIDDGTPNDDNFFLCQTFEKVKYIKIENSGGPAKPRNVGIREAKGKYIAFVDDDDLLMPNKLEKQVAVLENNPDFGLVHCCCQVIDENGIEKKEIIGRPGSLDVKHGDVSMRMMGNWTLMMPTPLIRREIIKEVGLFNEIIPPALEDIEYWTRCSFAGKFFYLDEPLVQYRVHSNNISKDNPNYFYLPLFMKSILQNQLSIKRINKKEYNLLLTNLSKMQIKMIDKGFFKTFKNLYILDFFWFFKVSNCKLLVYILLFKK